MKMECYICRKHDPCHYDQTTTFTEASSETLPSTDSIDETVADPDERLAEVEGDAHVEDEDGREDPDERHVKHVPENEEQGDHSRRPLQRVPKVALILITAAVGLPTADDNHPVNGVKQQRQEDKRPFHNRQQWPQTVNLVHRQLIHSRAEKRQRVHA